MNDPERAQKRVLILCTGNSARSQMAEGLLRYFGRRDFDVYSAGNAPSAVNPVAVRVMAELGIDISHHRSKSVSEFLGQQFDWVITVCDSAKESCPVFSGQPRRLHWSLPDPVSIEGSEEERLRVFRLVRDELHQRIWLFLASEHAPLSSR